VRITGISSPWGQQRRKREPVLHSKPVPIFPEASLRQRQSLSKPCWPTAFFPLSRARPDTSSASPQKDRMIMFMGDVMASFPRLRSSFWILAHDLRTSHFIYSLLRIAFKKDFESSVCRTLILHQDK
jgi:hypothetical protein